MERDPFLLVVNPHAGAGRASRNLPALLSALRAADARFEVARTRGPGDATVAVREGLAAGLRGVAVVGGDGTLNEAVNGFFDAEGAPTHPDAWLGPLSCGTGGDFRRTVGTPNVGPSGRGLDEVVTRMLWAKPRRIDVGWLRFVDDAGHDRERAFLNIASFGISGQVDRLVNDTPKWMGGTPAFLIGTLRALGRYRNQRVRVEVDGELALEDEVVNVAVANGRFFGGGMQVAPRAELDDGLFDVVGIALAPPKSLGLTRHLYAGTHLGREGISMTRGKVVHARAVDPSEHVLLDVDGEAPGRLPATFELRPGCLTLRA